MGCLHGTGARDGRCRSWRQPPLSCSMLPKEDRMEPEPPHPLHHAMDNQYSLLQGDTIAIGNHATTGTVQYQDRLTSGGIPIIKIRQSHDHWKWSWDYLILIMGIPILVRQHLSIETLPCMPWPSTTWPGYCWGQAIHRHSINLPDWQTTLPARIANPCSLKSLIITFRQKSWRYL